MIRRMTEPMHTVSQPLMSRQSYRHELTTVMFLPMGMSLVEGGVIAILADKVFSVGRIEFATILAAPMFANLTSFVWTWLAHGRRKVRFITTLMVLLCLCIMLIAMLPRNAAGGTMLVGLVILARCLMSGITTIRSTVWRQNYPRYARARITSKFSILLTLTLALCPAAVYYLLDQNQLWYQYLYPGVAAVALIGAFSFSRIRLRGEKALLAYERGHHVAGEQKAGNGGMAHLKRMFGVLKDDRFFRSYMTWQFVLGAGNMMGEVALIRMVSRATEGMANQFLLSIVIATALPMLVTMATMPLWARYLDRVHIVHFRTRQTLVLTVGMFGYWVAGLTGVVWLLLIPRAITGIGRGGGVLAWQLGHHDFADKKLVSVYMGIHATLTGVRGAFSAYVAIVLLDGWDAFSLGGWRVLGWGGMQYGFFVICGVMCMVSWAGFYGLHKKIRRVSVETPEAETAVALK